MENDERSALSITSDSIRSYHFESADAKAAANITGARIDDFLDKSAVRTGLGKADGNHFAARWHGFCGAPEARTRQVAWNRVQYKRAQ